MFFQTSLVAAALALPITAFPAVSLEQLATINQRTTPEDFQKIRRQQVEKRASTFDASKQHISTTGQNAFVAPNFAAGDQRGPCPGLNALANHGYLPHNGVAGMQDIIDATMNTYGMGADLSAFLSVYGTVFDGNPLSLSPGYSIGGAPPSGLGANILESQGLLGVPQGLT